MGNGVARELSTQQIAQILGVIAEDVLPLLQRLRAIGYEVRNSQTNPQIAENLQKEILWLVVTEGVVAREDLMACFSWTGEMDLDLLIEGMAGNGLIEEVNGYLRIHPDFAKNCYAVIR